MVVKAIIMKILVGLFIGASVLWSCKSQDVSDTKTENSNAMDKERTNDVVIASDKQTQEQDELAVVYSTSTRGFFEYIKITKRETVLSEDRYLKNIKTYPTQPADWDVLVKFIDSTDYKKFRQLEAPTGKRLYDGAPHAMLTIIKNEEEIRTPSFDHGQPPKDILNFVAKVLSIREAHIKP